MELVVAAGRRLARTRDHRQKIGEVAADQRQCLSLVSGNRLPALAGLGIDLQGYAADFHGGGGLANFESEVDVLAHAD